MTWGDFKALCINKARVDGASYVRLGNVPPFGSADDRELWRLFQMFCRISRQFWVPYLPLRLASGDQEVSLQDLSRCTRRIFRIGSVWVAGKELDAYDLDALQARFPQVKNSTVLSGTATSVSFTPPPPPGGFTVITDTSQNWTSGQLVGGAFTVQTGSAAGYTAFVEFSSSDTLTFQTASAVTGLLSGAQFSVELALLSAPAGWSESAREGYVFFNCPLDTSVVAVQNAVSGFADHIDLTANTDSIQIDVDAIEAAAECVVCWLARPVVSEASAISRIAGYSQFSEGYVRTSRGQGERTARYTRRITRSHLQSLPWRPF